MTNALERSPGTEAVTALLTRVGVKYQSVTQDGEAVNVVVPAQKDPLKVIKRLYDGMKDDAEGVRFGIVYGVHVPTQTEMYRFTPKKE